MDEPHLYRRVAEDIRQQILSGRLKAGDRLPSVREAAKRWNCTAGTIQHAYRELARQLLVTSRAGQGTRVVEHPTLPDETPLRRATLVHRAEAFLLEMLTGGSELEEVEWAMQTAMERWRLAQPTLPAPAGALRFVGSHDPALAWAAARFASVPGGCPLHLTFAGSLGGLIALAEGQADLAGCHLWDAETDSYNVPFVRRLLPGRRVALVTLARRRLGLLLAPGNPLGIHELADVARPGLRFANRQSGSGTRVWLDAALRRAGVETARISGYENEVATHSAVAQAVAEGQADAGLGLEAAALSFGLDFIFLTREPYDLVLPAETYSQPPVPALLEWLRLPATAQGIRAIGGYDTSATGQLSWVE